jgi:protein-tyrosine phosphatase
MQPDEASVSPADELRVLVVCTANVSRSPLTAALLARRLADAGVRASVASAGVTATRLAVDSVAVEVGRELGVDVSAHIPRRVTRELMANEGADVILGHTREHVRELVMLDRAAWDRTFTLKELSRRVSAERFAIRTAPSRWREVLGASRSPHDLLGDDARDDITDPYGRSLAVHRRVADDIDGELAILVDELFSFLPAVVP